MEASILLALRAVTLAGWLVLTVLLTRIAFRRDRDMIDPVRRAWVVMFVRHGVILMTTAMVEATWAVKALAPGSALSRLGARLYDPAYLLNGVIDALTPLLVVIVLVGAGSTRRVFTAAAGTVVGLGLVAAFRGAVSDWGVLMVSTQVLSFFAICGYLAFWGLVLLGHLPRVDAYLRGLLTVVTLFNILLPIQAEFFALVGRTGAVRIWLLNQVLQFTMMAAELVIALAYIHGLYRARRPPQLATTRPGGG